jgi:hypothetical protein
MPTPLPASLIKDLRQWKNKVKQERRRYKKLAILDLVTQAVTVNTYRGFRGQKPSKIFRPWACEIFEGPWGGKFQKLSTQRGYDRWLLRVADDLERKWSKSGKKIGVGQKFKLIDLLAKAICSSSLLPRVDGNRILQFLHAPLDQFVLQALKDYHHILPPEHKIKLPTRLGMGTVKSMDEYQRIQDAITWLTDQAKVPRIAFDYAHWPTSR